MKKLLTILLTVLLAVTTITFNVAALDEQNADTTKELETSSDEVIQKEDNEENAKENELNSNEVLEEGVDVDLATELNSNEFTEGESVYYKVEECNLSKLTDGTYIIVSAKLPLRDNKVAILGISRNTYIEPNNDGSISINSSNVKELSFVENAENYYLKSGDTFLYVNDDGKFDFSTESKSPVAIDDIPSWDYALKVDGSRISYTSNSEYFYKTDSPSYPAYLYKKAEEAEPRDITFNYNYEDCPDSQTVSQTNGSSYVFPSDFTKACNEQLIKGKAFAGWKAENEYVFQEGDIVDFDNFDDIEEIVVYAQWFDKENYGLVSDANAVDGKIPLSKLTGKTFIIVDRYKYYEGGLTYAMGKPEENNQASIVDLSLAYTKNKRIRLDDPDSYARIAKFEIVDEGTIHNHKYYFKLVDEESNGDDLYLSYIDISGDWSIVISDKKTEIDQYFDPQYTFQDKLSQFIYLKTTGETAANGRIYCNGYRWIANGASQSDYACLYMLSENNYNAEFYSDSTLYKTISETNDLNYVLPETNPTKVGYVFNGWYTAEEGGEQITDESIVDLTSNIKLYAHWLKADTYLLVDSVVEGGKYIVANVNSEVISAVMAEGEENALSSLDEDSIVSTEDSKIVLLENSGVAEFSAYELETKDDYSVFQLTLPTDRYLITDETVEINTNKGNPLFIGEIIDHNSNDVSYELRSYRSDNTCPQIWYDSENTEWKVDGEPSGNETRLYKKIEVPHTHGDWTYSVSDDKTTITASCGNIECDVPSGYKVSFSILPPEMEEYGDGKSPNATLSDGEQFTSDTGKELTIYYDGDPTKTTPPTSAGSHKASVTINISDESVNALETTVTAETTYTIKPAKIDECEISESFEPEYNGEVQKLTSEGIIIKSNGVSLEYGKDKDFTLTYTEDDGYINAGEHEVVVKLTENGNYVFGYEADEVTPILTKELKYDIAPALVSVSISEDDFGYDEIDDITNEIIAHHYIYDGESYIPKVLFKDANGNSINLSLENGDYSLTYKPEVGETNELTLINAGKYFMTVSLNDNGNYRFEDEEDVDALSKRRGYNFNAVLGVIIDQAKATISIPNHIADDNEYKPLDNLDLSIEYLDRKKDSIAIDDKDSLKQLIEKKLVSYGDYYNENDSSTPVTPKEVGSYFVNFTFDLGGNFYASETEDGKVYETKVTFDIENPITKIVAYFKKGDPLELEYNGKKRTPNIIFTDLDGNPVTLTKDVDYSVTYEHNKKSSYMWNGNPAANQPTVTITLINDDYAFVNPEDSEKTIDTVSKTFGILPMYLSVSINEETVEYNPDSSFIPEFTFTNKEGNEVELSELDKDTVDFNKDEGYVVYFSKGEHTLYEAKQIMESAIPAEEVKDAGTYTALLVLSRNYQFGKDELASLSKDTNFKRATVITFTISEKEVDYDKDIRPLVNDIIYDGNEHSPIDVLPEGVVYPNYWVTWRTKYTNKATNVSPNYNGYTGLLALKDSNYKWSDDSAAHIVKIDGKEYVEVPWKIIKRKAYIYVEDYVKTYGDRDDPEFVVKESKYGHGPNTGFVGNEIKYIYATRTREDGSENVGKYNITIIKNDSKLTNYEVITVYTGKLTIVPKHIQSSDVTINPETFIYNGKAQQPKATIKVDKYTTLTEGVEYTTVAYENKYSNDITNVGKKNIDIILLTNNYTFNERPNEQLVEDDNRVFERLTKQYEIVPAHVKATLSQDSYQYDSMPHCPKITVKVINGELKNTILVEDVNIHHTKDYKVVRPTLQEQIVAGDNKEITVTLNKNKSGTNNFVFEDGNASKVLTYKITKKPVVVTWLGQKTSYTYNNNIQMPKPTVSGLIWTDDVKPNTYATDNHDDSKKRIDSIDVGSYTAHVELLGTSKDNYEIVNSYYSWPSLRYSINPKHITVSWTNASHVYDGYTHSPNLEFKGDYQRDNLDYIQFDVPTLGELPQSPEDAEKENRAIFPPINASHYYTRAFITGNTYNYVIDNAKVDILDNLYVDTEFDIYPRQLEIVWDEKTLSFPYDGKYHVPEVKEIKVLNDDGYYKNIGIVSYDKGIVDIKVKGEQSAVGSNYPATAYLTSKYDFFLFGHPTTNYEIVNPDITFKIYRNPSPHKDPVKTSVE